MTVAVQVQGSISNIVSPLTTPLPVASKRPWLNVSEEMMFEGSTVEGSAMFGQISRVIP